MPANIRVSFVYRHYYHVEPTWNHWTMEYRGNFRFPHLHNTRHPGKLGVCVPNVKLNVKPVQYLIESLDRQNDRWEHIHGGATRLKDVEHYSEEIWLQPIYYHIKAFCRKFGVDCDWPILLSQQILHNNPGFLGQDMHLDCFGQYVVVLVALHPCRSTLFLDVEYKNFSKKKNSTDAYPYKWYKEHVLETGLNMGEIVIFFTNTPHAAPPNNSQYNRFPPLSYNIF